MAGKWEGFNERALRVVRLANQAALSMRDAEIYPEHVLYGIIETVNCDAVQLLTSLNVGRREVKSALLWLLPTPGDPIEQRQLRFSILAERVFDRAREEAALLGKNYVGSAHVLLALLKIEQGVAFKVLAGLGITYDKLRAEMMKIADRRASRRARQPDQERPAQPSADNPERPSADPSLVEKTKQQIRGMVVEIAQLAKQDLPESEFFQAFLDRVVCSLAAKGGAVWMLSNADTFELRSQVNWHEIGLAERPQILQRHAMLMHKTLAGGKEVVVAPHTDEAAAEGPCNPTDWLLVLGVLKVKRDLKGEVSGRARVDEYPTGVVEIFQRPRAPATTQRGYLKFLMQMCELANDFLRRSSDRH